jgi:UDP-2,4-diacetamido-2,4,6-trideoxy-beta-L-altropyranose hydrolase
MSKTLIIRADANPIIGSGHVMRCLALAQAWKEQEGGAIFVMHQDGDSYRQRLTSEGMKLMTISAESGCKEDAKQISAIARRQNCLWVVIDGYHFNADYQRIIKESGVRFLYADDNGHLKHYYSDILLNQHINADEALYKNRDPNTIMLLGTRYAFLRKEFLKFRTHRKNSPKVAQNILVTLGGSDPDNITSKVINALTGIDIHGLKIVVVIGKENLHLNYLKSKVDSLRIAVDLKHDVTNIHELMHWADVAVSSVGLTSLELAFMGLPNLILTIADNQKDTAKELHKHNISINLGDGSKTKTAVITECLTQLILSQELRNAMSKNGRKFVDGLGAKRILDTMQKIAEI